jgi:dUTP pyrophosphatase
MEKTAIMSLKVKKLHPDAILPSKKRKTDEGFDICSIEDVVVEAGTTVKISTGIAAMVDENHWLQLEGRSGMATKGLYPIGGVIDVGYIGEIGVMLANCSKEDYHVKRKDRIAQLIIRQHYRGDDVIEVEEFPESERGSDGFGASGR